MRHLSQGAFSTEISVQYDQRLPPESANSAYTVRAALSLNWLLDAQVCQHSDCSISLNMIYLRPAAVRRGRLSPRHRYIFPSSLETTRHRCGRAGRTSAGPRGGRRRAGARLSASVFIGPAIRNRPCRCCPYIRYRGYPLARPANRLRIAAGSGCRRRTARSRRC